MGQTLLSYQTCIYVQYDLNCYMLFIAIIAIHTASLPYARTHAYGLMNNLYRI